MNWTTGAALAGAVGSRAMATAAAAVATEVKAENKRNVVLHLRRFAAQGRMDGIRAQARASSAERTRFDVRRE
ncbi:hypothetical protein GCM10020369_69860 [Cryptosporangium minutisporangium]|uniref:Uncharacterized protein n=1 Tax=Cryptosporangium minutisporangium TaxID=113569 RepID=A0ABP6T858_9ACTN